MGITYTDRKDFTAEQLERLFLSVNWVSGKYPQRLLRALKNSPTVFTAWDGGRLAGLIRVIDDGELLAQIHYLLVDPQYQGQGIAGRLLEMVKERYKNYLYLEVMPEERRNAAFYEKHGFALMKDGCALQIANFI